MARFLVQCLPGCPSKCGDFSVSRMSCWKTPMASASRTHLVSRTATGLQGLGVHLADGRVDVQPECVEGCGQSLLWAMSAESAAFCWPSVMVFTSLRIEVNVPLAMLLDLSYRVKHNIELQFDIDYANLFCKRQLSE